MFFLLFLFSILGYAGAPGDPDMSITVKAFRGSAIFINKPVIESSGNIYQSSELEFLITSFMILHKDTYIKGSMVVSNIYNERTAAFFNPDCNWLAEPTQCAIENDMYVLDTQVIINPIRAYVSVILFDPEMNGIASATVTNRHQRQVIQLIKQEQSQTGLLGNNTTVTTNPQVPQLFNVEPYLYEKDFRQAVILMYSSI